MINTLIGKVFGTKNEREIKRLMPKVAEINALEPDMKKLSDEQLRAKTDEFRRRIQERMAAIPEEPEAESTAGSSSTPTDTSYSNKFWMKSWWKPSPSAAKPDAASSTCAISMCS